MFLLSLTLSNGKNMTDDKYLSDKEVSELLGLSIPKLRQDRQKNRGLPYVKIVRNVRYKKSDIDEYLSKHRVSFS